MRSNCRHRCGRILAFAVVGVAVAGLAVMWLWNWLMPDLFGLRPIGYLQALAVLVLSKILFGSLHGHCRHGRCHGDLADRMTPEERARFEAGVKSKWCGCGSSDAPDGDAKSAG